MNDAPGAPSRYLTDKQKQWRKMHPKEKTLLSEFPELAAQWHYEKNEGLTPEDVAPHSGKKVWWKCNDAHRAAGNRQQSSQWERMSVLCGETSASGL